MMEHPSAVQADDQRRPGRTPWSRLAVAILPWLIAAVGMLLSVDGMAFEGDSQKLFMAPPAPTEPDERPPPPKSEERIDPSERVNV